MAKTLYRNPYKESKLRLKTRPETGTFSENSSYSSRGSGSRSLSSSSSGRSLATSNSSEVSEESDISVIAKFFGTFVFGAFVLMMMATSHLGLSGEILLFVNIFIFVLVMITALGMFIAFIIIGNRMEAENADEE